MSADGEASRPPASAGRGAPRAFDGVEHWIFDLDNTLYPAHCRLFAQIDRRMADFIAQRLGVDEPEARRVQKDYYARYGTTLAGLMLEYAVAPHDFMAYVHDIDVSVVPPNPELAARIDALPGRKYVFTNGSVAHAENVARRVGVAHCFDDVFDIAAADWTPKPQAATYAKFVERCGVAPARAAMFEDLARNLEAPAALGMTTVLVQCDAAWFADEPAGRRPARPGDPQPDHVHHATEDLAAFLGDIA
ncbi:MAG: pyrimidine 5'-nucleotidase [Parvularculaceae bacterium]